MNFDQILEDYAKLNNFKRNETLLKIQSSLDTNSLDETCIKSNSYQQLLKLGIEDSYDVCRESTCSLLKKSYESLKENKDKVQMCDSFMHLLLTHLIDKASNEIEEVKLGALTVLTIYIEPINKKGILKEFDTIVKMVHIYVKDTCPECPVLLLQFVNCLHLTMKEEIHMIQEQLIISLALLSNHKHKEVRRTMVNTLLSLYSSPFDRISNTIPTLYPAFSILTKDKIINIRLDTCKLLELLLNINTDKNENINIITYLSICAEDSNPAVKELALNTLKHYNQ
ncbi:hypothetical protein WA158_008022 [Blastocystis sp. Blastoise]